MRTARDSGSTNPRHVSYGSDLLAAVPTDLGNAEEEVSLADTTRSKEHRDASGLDAQLAPDQSEVVWEIEPEEGSSARGRRLRLLASVVLAILVWEFVARVVVDNALFFPALTAVAIEGWDLLVRGDLVLHMRVTFFEFLYGLLGATIIGIPLGVALASWEKLRELAEPWLFGLYSTPLVALAPLVILWLGLGTMSKVAVVFFMAVFPIIINTTAGILATDEGLVEVARSFQLGKYGIMRKVLLPSALSYIVTGIRLAVGRGIVGAVVAEFFGARAGLGFLILVSSQRFAMADLMVAVIVLAAAGIAGNAMVLRLERRLAPWRSGRIKF